LFAQNISGQTVWSDYTPFKLQCFTKIGSSIFAGSDQGVHLTTNYGKQWYSLNLGLTNFNVHALASMGIYMYAATDSGVFISKGDGKGWVRSGKGFPEGNYSSERHWHHSPHTVSSFVVAGNLIFAGHREGVFVSSDSGYHWALAGNGIAEYGIEGLVYVGNKLFAGTEKGLYVSGDMGKSWVLQREWIPNGGINTRFMIRELTLSDSTIYAGLDISGYVTSPDSGKTWTTASQEFWDPEKSKLRLKVDLHAADGDRIFVSSNLGLWASLDRGFTWKKVWDHQANSIAFMGESVYFSQEQYPYGIWKSSDGGSNWKRINKGLESTFGGQLTVVGQTLFLTISYHGVFQSIDQGETWTKVTPGFKQKKKWNNSFRLYKNGKKLVLGTSEYGVSISSDNGKTWTNVVKGLYRYGNKKYISCIDIRFNGNAICVQRYDGVGKPISAFELQDGASMWTPYTGKFPLPKDDEDTSQSYKNIYNVLDYYSGCNILREEALKRYWQHRTASSTQWAASENARIAKILREGGCKECQGKGYTWQPAVKGEKSYTGAWVTIGYTHNYTPIVAYVQTWTEIAELPAGNRTCPRCEGSGKEKGR
jgi:photosystem II stability/assembly factor-like uncharacterized protein